MSTTAALASPLGTRPRGGPLAGTATLLRFALRRDRRRLAYWVLGLGGMAVYSATALPAVYPTAADREARAAALSGPAGVLLTGPGYGRADYTIGAMIANELGLTLMVAAAIMSILLLVRHTRAEEESGRADLVGAGAVGRRAPLAAALALVLVADAAVAAVIVAGLAATGSSVVDSAAFALGIALTGMVFGGVAAVTAQTTEYARAATGTALAVLGVAVLVRGIGDVLRAGGSTLSWFSPIAWPQQTRAFVDLRWWPLLLSFALAAVLPALAYRLVDARDTGAGLRAPRRGRAEASARLSGVAGLTVRVQRGSAIGWGAGAVVLAAVFGSLTQSVTDLVSGNEQLRSVLATRGADLTAQFAALSGVEVALLVTAFAVASVLRIRGEEGEGRLEVLLATALDRRRLLGTAVGFAAVASLLLLAVAGLVAGVSAAAATGDAAYVGRFLAALLAPLPAVLVVVGAAAALVGLAPRRASLAWVLVGWVLLVGLFGPLLRLPDWAAHLSPFAWVPAVPAESADPVALAVLTLVAAALVAAGLAGFRRRDVPA